MNIDKPAGTAGVSPAREPRADEAGSAAGSPSLAEFARASLKVGCLGFGGPVGQIALMHRVFVDEKKWIDEERYLHALNYCMLLPGPEAQQLATYVGWRLHGIAGGMIAGALFVLPGALIVLALSVLYVLAGRAPLVTAAFDGVKAAVLALVIEAMLRIGRRALKGSAAWWIAAASFAALFVFHAPFPLVILSAGVLGIFLAQTGPKPRVAETQGARADDVVGQPGTRPLRWSHAFLMAGFWTAVWLAPPAISLLALGPDHMLTAIGRLFSTLAVVTFGGAYASLAYLQQAAVEQHHWLSAAQMIDGLGLAETTPGPLVLVHQFVGFLAGWNEGGWALAIAGAAMASWCTFAPSFVWIFAGAPFAERLRTNRFAAAALAAITAAVLGVITQLALWFAAHVLFSDVQRTPIGLGASLPIPEWSSFNVASAGLAIAAIVALVRFKVGVVWLVLAAAGAGCLVRLVLGG